jgi:hypothetical protein
MNKPSGKQPSFLERSNNWTMAAMWNMGLTMKKDRPTVERDRVWASELGKPVIEVFLKMRGVAPSNPPNPRAKRKFEAGNMFEWIIGLILKRAGILKSAQEYVTYQYPGMVTVSGKSDFKAGGIPDYDNWKTNLDALELPEFFVQATEQIMANFAEKYPEGLGDMYIEVKSCSSFMMDEMEHTGRASKNHRLQLFHYLKSNNFPRGMVVYLCRDDLRMFEVSVEYPSDVEAEYKEEIERISTVYNQHKNTPLDTFLVKPDSSDSTKWEWNPKQIEGLPLLEPLILWDKDLCKFSRNWGVEYSSYLTMLYGFETQFEFEEAVKPTVTRWNAALARVRKIQERAKWLSDLGRTEEEVQQEPVPGSPRKKGKQYVINGSYQEFLPDIIQGSVKLSPLNIESVEAMKWAGLNVEELAAQFADEEETAEEI